VLRDVEDREIAIPLDAIEAKKEGGSIMPVGLADELTRGELVDLVRFLSELGKVGPYAVSKARVARRWDALVSIEGKGPLHPDTFEPAAADQAAWTSVYSNVAGNLPVEAVSPAANQESLRVVRAQADIAIGGKVDLVATGPIKKLWLDNQPLTLAENM